MTISSRLAVVAATTLLLAGCGADVDDLGPDTARVDLEFTDASVPPENHRSWTLLLESAGPLGTVTDYEDVLHTELAAMPEDEWARFVDDLPDLLDGFGDDAEGCAGGTTLEVTVYELADDGGDNDELESVEATSCSEDGSAAIDAMLRAVTPMAEPTGLPERARSWPR